MNVSTPLADRLGSYLDLAAAQAKTTATNMANIDTPGYRTVGFDFDAEMQQAMGSAATPDSGAANTLAPHVGEVDGLLERPDGNNVSMERESMQLAEAQLKFRTWHGAGEAGIYAHSGCDPCGHQVAV